MLSKYIWFLLIGFLSACNNGGSGPSEAEQLKAVQDKTKAYFLYESDQSIKAIDINVNFDCTIDCKLMEGEIFSSLI